jgi:hypothetical protein
MQDERVVPTGLLLGQILSMTMPIENQDCVMLIQNSFFLDLTARMDKE